MSIKIDRRVGSGELSKYFTEEQAEVTDLEFGDFAFPGNGPDGPVHVGVERKQIKDLMDSIKTGRLWGHQIPGMLNMYDYSYLVIEGIFKTSPDYLMVPLGRRWKKLYMGSKVIDPYLNTIQVLTGIMVCQTSGKKHTAQLVEHLYRWWQRDFSEHGQYGAYQRAIRLPEKLTNGALVFKVSQTLPRIGIKKGLRIRTYFSSVLQMVNASEEDWLNIPDIGPKLAKTIREALGHEAAVKAVQPPKKRKLNRKTTRKNGK